MAIGSLALLAGAIPAVTRIAQSIFDTHPDVDTSGVDAVNRGKYDDPALAAELQRARNLQPVATGHFMDEMRRQQLMAQAQQAYINRLRGYASGQVSDARSLAEQERVRLAHGMLGQAASQRGRYNPALQRSAIVGASQTGMEMAAPTEAAAARERQQAQAALAQYYQGKSAQDVGAFGQAGGMYSDDMRQRLLNERLLQDKFRYGQQSRNVARKTETGISTQDARA